MLMLGAEEEEADDDEEEEEEAACLILCTLGMMTPGFGVLFPVALFVA